MKETDKTHDPLDIGGVFFARKPSCISDINKTSPEGETPDVAVVEKVVVLSHSEFVSFQSDLCADRAFIRKYNDDMYLAQDGKWHCLLVIGAGERDGILIEAEDFSYPRYTALLRDADLIDKSRIPHVAGWLNDPLSKRRPKDIER